MGLLYPAGVVIVAAAVVGLCKETPSFWRSGLHQDTNLACFHD